jgi:hypothetical protein
MVPDQIRKPAHRRPGWASVIRWATFGMKGRPETHETATHPFGHSHTYAVPERPTCCPLRALVIDSIWLE